MFLVVLSYENKINKCYLMIQYQFSSNYVSPFKNKTQCSLIWLDLNKLLGNLYIYICSLLCCWYVGCDVTLTNDRWSRQYLGEIRKLYAVKFCWKVVVSIATSANLLCINICAKDTDHLRKVDNDVVNWNCYLSWRNRQLFVAIMCFINNYKFIN